MKLSSCHIDNFGKFHDFNMMFDDGLTVILHENGWGKSTLAAFLKAMLYGFGTKRSKDLTENERKRYLPWQGGTYGGSLTFEKEGKSYQVTRTFGETPRFDTVTLVDANTGKKIPRVENVGEWLFKLDADAFKRSAFITQNQLNAGGTGLSFHARLNAVLGEASDVAAYDSALEQLTKRMKDYEKTGNRGRIAEIQKKIDELLQQQQQARDKIHEVEGARTQIAELDQRIYQLTECISEMKTQAEEENDAAKERKAALGLYNDLLNKKQAAELELTSLFKEVDGLIPSSQEIQGIRQTLADIAKAEEDLALMQKAREKDVSAIQEQYDALLDEQTSLEEKVDELRAEFGSYIPTAQEVQQARDTEKEIDRISAELKDIQVKAAEQQEKIRNIEGRYDGSLPSMTVVSGIIPARDALTKAEESLSDYDAMIERAKDAEERQRTLLDLFGNNLPDVGYLKQIQSNLEKAAAQNRNVDDLERKIYGEKAKLDSLDSAIAQYGQTIQNAQFSEKPPKNGGAYGYFAGTVAGLVAGIMASPFFFPVAAVLLVAGVFFIRNHGKAKAEYTQRQKAFEDGVKQAEEKKTALEQERASIAEKCHAMEEAARKSRTESERILTTAVEALKEWDSTVSAETAAQICANLQSKRAELEEVKRVVESTQRQIQSARERITSLREQYEEAIGCLPAATSDQPLEDRIAAVHSDIDAVAQAWTASELYSDQVKKAQESLEQLKQEFQSFLQKCGIDSLHADTTLDSLSSRLSTLTKAEQEVSNHQKRVTDFETANQAALAPNAENSAFSAEAKIKARLKMLNESLTRSYTQYHVEADQVETWLTVSEARAKEKAEIEQRIRVLAGQIAEYKSTHMDFLKSYTQDAGAHSPLQEQIRQHEAELERQRSARIQAEDKIRYADEALASYHMIVQKLRYLGAEKQKAQRSLYTLKKSIELLKQAKDHLASRYLGRIEANLNQCLSAWANRDNLQGILDTDFHISMEEQGVSRAAEGFSTGYTDMIDFCMRIALIDTLFEAERPFIIMDDPFVNLDQERVNHALRLLKAISADSQIIYFVCHEVRASEPDEDIPIEIRRKRLIRTVPKTAQNVSTPKAKKYTLVPANAIEPANTTRKISNNIFSLVFYTEDSTKQDGEYEVFFVDEAEQVLCDKQRVSVSDGEVLPSKVQFCLNTGKATGTNYTLIVRNVSRAENEVVKMIPFEVSLAFVSEFDF